MQLLARQTIIDALYDVLACLEQVLDYSDLETRERTYVSISFKAVARVVRGLETREASEVLELKRYREKRNP